MDYTKDVFKAALLDKFGGSDGFGSLAAAFLQLGVSDSAPLVVTHEPVHSSGDPYVVAGAGRPVIAVYDWFFDISNPETWIVHELGHYWDQRYNHGLSAWMKQGWGPWGPWVNWGQEATTKGLINDSEDFAEATRIYFWPNHVTQRGRMWSDEWNAGLAESLLHGARGMDDLWLDPATLEPVDHNPDGSVPEGAIRTRDRYDFLQFLFGHSW